MQKTISVIIADAHFLVREGLKNLIVRQSNVRLMDTAENEEKLIEILHSKNPDIVFIDPFQPAAFTLNTLKAIKESHPNTKFIVITSEDKKEMIYKTLEINEVACFLTKECDDFEIIEGITAIRSNEKYFCKKIVKLIWQKSFGKEDDDCKGIPLSEREIQIVKLVVAGKITKEIARELELSPHTVYTHRKNIMKKLKLNSTPELVLFAVNHGLIKAG